MGTWYQTTFVDSGRSGALWVVIGFVATYAITRTITRNIRARSGTSDGGDTGGAFKNVHIGGIHVHHQVWGILLVLVAGMLEFRFSPGSPGQEILGAAFGAGAALALDEFALWLHVEDVYWSEEGRKSIDAVMVALVIGVALLAGFSPLGIAPDTREAYGLIGASIFVLILLTYTVVCLLKGKIIYGLLGFVLPFLSLTGSIRIAKPDSFWARRFYGEGKKMAKSRARFDDRHDARRERLRDLLSFGGGVQ